jgi:hypothetical protein
MVSFAHDVSRTIIARRKMSKKVIVNGRFINDILMNGHLKNQ